MPIRKEGRRYHGEKKRTWKDDRQRFHTYLEEPLGKRKLSEITRAMVADVLCEAGKGNGKKPGKSVATIRNIRALVSHMFNMAVNWGYLEQNPIQGLKVAGKKVTRARFLQAHELRPFFEAVAKEGEMTRDYILLALLTGVRRSNLNAMRWDEIDLIAGEWHIPRTKNDEPQTVTLCPEAVDILRKRVEISAQDEERIAAQRKNHGKSLLPTGFVFPSRGKTGHIAEPRDAVMRVMRQAGIPYGRKTENGVTLHDLRRTLGSWQARTGASLAVIGKSLNHKSLQATAIYARLDLDPVRQSVNTATLAMLEAAGLKESADVVKRLILRHNVAPL
jgi:integrase